MTHNFKLLIKRLALSLAAFLLLIVAFTVYANVMVEKAANERVYTSVDAIHIIEPLFLLGTNPLNKWGRPNSYFTNRIKTASELFQCRKGKITSLPVVTIIPKNMTNQRLCVTHLWLMEFRRTESFFDFAGFRTLDSVVRAKEIFGCDSLTIISQADHNARALYLAEANGIEAVAVSAPLRAGRWVRTRLCHS